MDIRTYLQKRSENTVRWGSAHQHIDDLQHGEIHTGYIDIYVPDIQEACGTNWVWTVENPEDPNIEWEPTKWTLRLPAEHTIHRIWDRHAGKHEEDGKSWHIGAHIWHHTSNPGEALPEETVAEIEELLENHPERRLETTWGWSSNAVSEAIREWIRAETGREMTVTFELDQEPSGNIQALIERLEGSNERNLLTVTENGTEIHAHPGALDDLLALDPETAAEIVEIMKTIAKEHE